MSFQERFINALRALAHRCNYQLTEFDLELYLEEANRMSLEHATAALTAIYKETPAGGRFPAVNDMIARSNITGLSDEEQAREAAALIADAVQRCGYNRPEKAREHMGELAWRIVQLSGGWPDVCQALEYDNMPTLVAQWRQLAISQLAKARGGFHGPPSLPDGTEKPVLRLVSEIAAQCERK